MSNWISQESYIFKSTSNVNRIYWNACLVNLFICVHMLWEIIRGGCTPCSENTWFRDPAGRTTRGRATSRHATDGLHSQVYEPMTPLLKLFFWLHLINPCRQLVVNNVIDRGNAQFYWQLNGLTTLWGLLTSSSLSRGSGL